MSKMEFDCGFNIKAEYNPLGFIYGNDVFGPKVENRRLEDIRKSLLDPGCNGPEIVYSIAMDVGKLKDKDVMEQRNLLYGAVTYAKGKLGKEPVRSQGHIHAVSKSCNTSTPEVYEIWSGEAIIYMQETARDNPGRCFAVKALPGEVVIVPPGWAHATISSNPNEPLTFGAWCVRDYGFEYKEVREHKGLAFFPILDKDDNIFWVKNENYEVKELIEKSPRCYKEFSIETGKPIYTQFEENPDRFLFVSNPNIANSLWHNFIP
jgi:glucose-6-phosphate isomerase